MVNRKSTRKAEKLVSIVFSQMKGSKNVFEISPKCLCFLGETIRTHLICKLL